MKIIQKSSDYNRLLFIWNNTHSPFVLGPQGFLEQEDSSLHNPSLQCHEVWLVSVELGSSLSKKLSTPSAGLLSLLLPALPGLRTQIELYVVERDK